MIKKIINIEKKVSDEIFRVFQKSYQVEADLIGSKDFPPLKRSSEDIQNSITAFYGYFEDEDLAAVIEINHTGDYKPKLKICSLTVDPQHFRKGIAAELISFVLCLPDVYNFEVETAVVNLPAINLYEKHGFVEYKQHLPDHGIPKVVMRRQVDRTM